MNDLKKTNKKKTGVKSPKQNNCIVHQTIYRPIGHENVVKLREF